MKRIIIFIALLIMPLSLKAGIHEDVNELIKKGELQTAEKMAMEAVDKNPVDTESLCALACVYRNMAYREGVLFDSTAAGIKEGESGTGEYNRDTIDKIFTPLPAYDEEVFKKAETIYFKIIDIDKTYKNAYFNLLNSYAVMKSFDRYFPVIDLYLANLDQDPDTPHVLNDLAGKLFRDGMYDEAIRLFTICIDRYPGYAPAVCDLGAVYFQQGDISGAYRQFSAAYKIDENDSINLGNLARSCIYLEDFTGALEYYTILVNRTTEDIFNLYTTGMLGYMSGADYKPNFLSFIESRKKQTQDADKDFWLFTAGKFLELDTFETKEKTDFFEFLLDSFSKNRYDTYSIMAGNILLRQGQNSFALVAIASIFDRLRFTEKTIAYLEKIEDRKKDEPQIMTDNDLHFNFGRNYLYAGKVDRSLNHFLKMSPDPDKEAAVNYYLGRIYYIKKDSEKAKLYFLKNRDMNGKEDMFYINESIRYLRAIMKDEEEKAKKTEEPVKEDIAPTSEP